VIVTEHPNTEALALSGEILRDIEVGATSLTSAALKASRLARLLGDAAKHRMFTLEAGGYASGEKALAQADYQIALGAGRRTTGFDQLGRFSSDMVWTESIEALESKAEALRIRLESSTEAPTPRISTSVPTERQSLQNALAATKGQIASRRQLIYEYALAIHYELKYADVAESSFERLRNKVDAAIAEKVPDAVQKFSSVYDNLRSKNAEDWANAVHSCRRILQDLADVLSPPTDEIRTVRVGGRDIEVRYGPDQYINRLVRYVEERSGSKRFEAIVGSDLALLGDRLDAAFRAAQKGSHGAVNRDEAERYVLFTYMVVGDILGLEQPE